MWVAVHHRLFTKHEAIFPSSKEAYDFLEIGARNGDLAPESIIAPNGKVYLYPYRGGSSVVWHALGKE